MGPYKCPPGSFVVPLCVLYLAVYYCDMPAEPGEDGPVEKALQYHPNKKHEIWRFLTYALIHTDQDQLFSNLLRQLGAGLLLEIRHGWWRVALLYMSGVAAGSVGTSLTDHKLLVGSSSATYALFTAHIAEVVMNWQEFKMKVFFLVTFFMPTGKIFWRLSERYVMDVESNFAVIAQAAGSLAGLLMGIVLLIDPKTKREKTVWLASAVLYPALMSAGVFATMSSSSNST